MNKKYTLIERAPKREEYMKLRASAGWGTINGDAVQAALNNSLYSVCAMSGNEIIGCGRVIGDGGIYFYIQDVIVLPESQGQGVGTAIMGSLMNYLKKHALKGAFIGLMAAKGAAGFYRRFGVKERPPDGPGMFIIME